MSQATKTTYLTCAQTAKLVRSALKKAFPSVRFSVTSSTTTVSVSVRVSYVGGPARSAVEQVTAQFTGATMHAVADLKVHHNAPALVNGQVGAVQHGADFIFVTRRAV